MFIHVYPRTHPSSSLTARTVIPAHLMQTIWFSNLIPKKIILERISQTRILSRLNSMYPGSTPSPRVIQPRRTPTPTPARCFRSPGTATSWRQQSGAGSEFLQRCALSGLRLSTTLLIKIIVILWIMKILLIMVILRRVRLISIEETFGH